MMKPRARYLNTKSRQIILEEASELFGRYGYDATSMRDISASLGIAAAALYNHFRSKDDIYFAAYEQGMTQIMSTVRAAMEGARTPWDRLEALACAHCAVLLSSTAYRTIISPNFPKSFKGRKEELIALRNSYEALVQELVSELKLPAERDPMLFRMQLLGALNWSTTWFKEGGRFKPEDVGREIVRTLRHGVEQRSTNRGKDDEPARV